MLSDDREEGNRAAFFMIGFCYRANAGGRLLGTVLSGLTYQVGGLALMLGTATAVVALSALASGRLSPEHPQVRPA